mmetsp:Transcript_2500/g.4542  ORF Transcript_2500/g.4542 Transcript_2500/m.4542 type:complete len:451 (+) Transcript_2500:54-1406(+)
MTDKKKPDESKVQETVSDVIDEDDDDDNESLFDNESDDSLDEEGNVKTDIASKLRKKKRQLIKMIVDYGPPYSKAETGEAMVDECSKPEPSLFEMHTMLNNRVTPNYRDPEDFYNSSMHWCARHCTILAMRLLRRAKADVNIQNEFGQTPLHVLCMMKLPPSRRKKQFKTFMYMLSQGCDVNIRDKAGYCAIDYCAMNGAEKMVQVLVDVGAHVLRDNHMLVAQRAQLVGLAGNEKTSQLLKDVVKETLDEKEEEEQRKRIEKALAEEYMATKKRREKMEQKRQDAHEYRKKLAQQEYEDMRARNRQQKMEEEEEMLRKERGSAHKKFGGWEKIEGGGGRWGYRERATERDKNSDKNSVYKAGKKQMLELKAQNSYEVANARWENKTGNKLEIDWSTKEKMFDIPGLEDDNKETVAVKKVAEEIQDGLLFRDENDKELEGEDLDDLLDIL